MSTTAKPHRCRSSQPATQVEQRKSGVGVCEITEDGRLAYPKKASRRFPTDDVVLATLNGPTLLLRRRLPHRFEVQAAPHCGEGVANGDVQVLMRAIFRRCAVHHVASTWHGQINAHVTDIALTVVPIGRLHDHSARANSIGALRQLIRPTPPMATISGAHADIVATC